MRCLPLTALLLTSGLTAQAVGVSMTALTPLTVQASNGVATNNYTQPAGPMSGSGSIYTAITNGGWAGASTSWNHGATSRLANATITHDVGNLAQQATFVGGAGQDEYLITFTSATQRTVHLNFYRDTILATGAAAPTAQVDLDNDGTIDIQNVSTVGTSPYLKTFGPQPLVVRVIMATPLGAQTSSFQRLSVTATPANNLTLTTPVTTCTPGVPSPPPFLAPSFDNMGVDMFVHQSLSAPSLIVLSLNPQPFLLGMNGTFPCLTLPAPDVVLMPPTGTFNVALPAAVRPVTFYAQGVALTSQGLLTSDGYAVTAH